VQPGERTGRGPSYRGRHFRSTALSSSQGVRPEQVHAARESRNRLRQPVERSVGGRVVAEAICSGYMTLPWILFGGQVRSHQPPSALNEAKMPGEDVVSRGYLHAVPRRPVPRRARDMAMTGGPGGDPQPSRSRPTPTARAGTECFARQAWSRVMQTTTPRAARASWRRQRCRDSLGDHLERWE